MHKMLNKVLIRWELAYGAKHGGHDFKAVNQIYDIWSKNIK